MSHETNRLAWEIPLNTVLDHANFIITAGTLSSSDSVEFTLR